MSLYSEDHRKLLTSFLKHQVKFLIIGGHAAIYYGVNRNTGDLDILIEPTIVNGFKVVGALKEIDLDVPDFTAEEFERRLVLSFGFEPEAVDILNFTPGIEFAEVYKNSKDVNFDGLMVKMIDIRDLIKNKESLNREGPKSLLDQYDVLILKKILKKNNED